jgi:hypothetical protein
VIHRGKKRKKPYFEIDSQKEKRKKETIFSF